MNKKLENLLIEFDEMGYEPTTLCENPQKEVANFRNRLKQALTELQAIKEAKPSEALEKLESIREYSHSLTMVNYLVMNSDLDIVKQALLKAQEQEKENTEYKEVLRIIFEKNVDIDKIKKFIKLDVPKVYNVHYYNEHLWKRKHQKKLTEEEFDTLKRWSEKCQK